MNGMTCDELEAMFREVTFAALAEGFDPGELKWIVEDEFSQLVYVREDDD